MIDADNKACSLFDWLLLIVEAETGARLFDGLVLPVDVGALEELHGARYVRYDCLVAARLQKEHRPTGHLAQPVGQHRSRGTAADHDKVVLVFQALRSIHYLLAEC